MTLRKRVFRNEDGPSCDTCGCDPSEINPMMEVELGRHICQTCTYLAVGYLNDDEESRDGLSKPSSEQLESLLEAAFCRLYHALSGAAELLDEEEIEEEREFLRELATVLRAIRKSPPELREFEKEHGDASA